MPFHIRPFLTLPLALITLLVLRSGPAYAEWVLIDKTEQGMYTYVDPDSIRRTGDLVEMWHMLDLTTAINISGNPSLSVKAQRQYDCPKELYHEITYAYFSERLGTGKVIYSSPHESKWEAVAPQSIADVLWKYACNKK
jgi:hypothetical protein